MNGIIHGGPMNTAAFKIKNRGSKEKLRKLTCTQIRVVLNSN